MPGGRSNSRAKLGDFALDVLCREPNRRAHVKCRARTERAHVVGRDVGVRVHDEDRGGVDVEDFGGDLRHRRIGALPHVDGADIQTATAVGIQIDDRDRRRRRGDALEADRNAAPAPDAALAAIEGPFQFNRSAT